MFSFLSLTFIFYFCYFFLAVFVTSYIPGSLLLRKQKLSFFNQLALSVTLGLVLFSLQGMLFGYMQMRFLTYAYIFISLGVWTYLFIKNKQYKNVFKPLRIPFLVAFIVIMGTIGQLTTTWFAGVPVPEGIYYCCGETRDNILHLAYVKEIVEQIPPLEPGLANTTISNYHYLGHVYIAELIRIFVLPLQATAMQFVPLLLCLLLGGLAIVFSNLLHLSNRYKAWLLFFLYFGGDFVYVLIYTAVHQIKFLKPSLLETGPHFLFNLPFAFGVLAVFLGINLFILWEKQRNALLGVLLAIVMGSVIEYKVNFVFLALGGMGVVAVLFALKKDYSLILYTILAAILSALLFLPVTAGKGGFIFVGFWKSEDFIVNPVFNYSHYELARRVYLDHKSWLRVLQYDLIFTALFFISALGTKCLAFFQTKNSIQQIPFTVNIFLFVGILLSSFVGFSFLQNPGGANSIFFFLAAYVFLSIYVALACDWWLQKVPSVASFIIAVSIVLLTLPQPLYEIKENINMTINRSVYTITNKELDALLYLEKKTPIDAIVLVDPNNPISFETPYVYLYTNRQMYLAGQGDELQAHGIPYAKQKEVADTIFFSKNSQQVRNALYKNNISYLYMKSNRNIVSRKNDAFLTVFDNTEYKIIKVKKQNL